MTEITTNFTSQLYITFEVAGRFFGIDVTKVQRLISNQTLTPVPLAKNFVQGLINIRGQIATTIGMREFFSLGDENSSGQTTSIVCYDTGVLISITVDHIRDVLEFENQQIEDTPHTVPVAIRKYIKGVYKTSNGILSILDIGQIIADI